MSSYLCFVCHSTVNNETNEETREKYRDVVGIHLCPDSHLCYICCHVLNKLYLFKAICFKRSLEYPVLFSEKGTLYLQRNDLEIHVLCPEDCDVYLQKSNFKTYHYNYNNINDIASTNNEYVKLEDNDFHEYLSEINKENNDFDITQNNDELVNNNVYNEEINELNNYNNDLVYDIDTDKNNDVDSNIDNYVCNEENNYVDEGEVDREIQDDGVVIVNDKDKDIYDDLFYNQNETDSKHEMNKDHSKDDKNRKRKKPKKSFKKIVLSTEEQKSELEANRREKKYLEAEFKCYNCALSFLFKDTHQAHMMRHEESNGEFQCPVCTLRFATQALLRSHSFSHVERYKCTKCLEILKRKSTKTHPCVQIKESQGIACHLCGNLLKNVNGLQQHLRRVHSSTSNPRLTSCGICGERYSGHALRTHMLKHIKKKFPCDLCSSVFSSPYTLSHHRKKHTAPSEAHYCSTCGVGYSSRKSLLAHRRNSVVHQMNMLECPICGRACPGRRALALHSARVHEGRTDHACALCPARYTTRGGLLRHIDTHKEKPPMKVAVCHLCGNSFKDNNKLNRHLREVCEKDRLEEELSTLYE